VHETAGKAPELRPLASIKRMQKSKCHVLASQPRTKWQAAGDCLIITVAFDQAIDSVLQRVQAYERSCCCSARRNKVGVETDNDDSLQPITPAGPWQCVPPQESDAVIAQRQGSCILRNKMLQLRASPRSLSFFLPQFSLRHQFHLIFISL
jgi:hypothetical protein